MRIIPIPTLFISFRFKTPTVADWKEFVVNLGMAEEDKGKTGWRGSAKWARVLGLEHSGFYRNYALDMHFLCPA